MMNFDFCREKQFFFDKKDLEKGFGTLEGELFGEEPRSF